MTPIFDPSLVRSHVLRSPGVEVTVLSVGCAVQSWVVDGLPVVLGYADPLAYLHNPVSMGIVVGRVANRIRRAQITVEGQVYDLDRNHGGHCIHGGAGGVGWCNWDLTPLSDRAVRLSLVSPHLDQGFPGEMRLDVTLHLEGRALVYEMQARSDRRTPVNLAQHQYFNLMGAGDIRDHDLQVQAARYTPTGPDYFPTGQIAPVEGTAYDFRRFCRIAEADPEARGHDASFVLDSGPGPQAVLRAPGGLSLRLTTNRPCLQLYTGGGLGPQAEPGPGAAHKAFGGLCLEAQDWPDAQAQGFPETQCGPGLDYAQRTVIEIG